MTPKERDASAIVLKAMAHPQRLRVRDFLHSWIVRGALSSTQAREMGIWARRSIGKPSALLMRQGKSIGRSCRKLSMTEGLAVNLPCCTAFSPFRAVSGGWMVGDDVCRPVLTCALHGIMIRTPDLDVSGQLSLEHNPPVGRFSCEEADMRKLTDIDILKTVAEYRLLTLPQITLLHFPSRQVARRRLRQMKLDGLVALAPHGLGGNRGRTVLVVGQFDNHASAVERFLFCPQQCAQPCSAFPDFNFERRQKDDWPSVFDFPYRTHHVFPP